MKPDVTASRHRVEVVRHGEWWAITVPSLRGVFSQARHLDEVPAAAREAIAMMLGVDPADVGLIDVHVQEQGRAGLSHWPNRRDAPHPRRYGDGQREARNPPLAQGNLSTRP